MGHKFKQKKIIENKTDFFYYAFRNIVVASVPILIVSAFILSLPKTIAIDASSADRVVLALPSSCTLSSVVDTAHTDTILNGTYKSGIGQTTLGTFCNDENGYIIYAIGATNDLEGNTVLASSISTPNSSIGDNGNYDIVTGLAESGDTSNWAIKLSYKAGDTSTAPPIIETDYENKYALIPNDWTKVVSKQAGTTDMNKGSNFTTTYAVYTSPTQPAGTYTGQVKFALFHPSNSAKPTTLAQAYKNAGKQKITVTDPITGETGDYYKMQDMATAICDATNVTGEASQTQLVDIRDNKLYYATKLLDGHCWMTQNLDLDLNSEVALTSEDTDLNDGTLGGAYIDGYRVDGGMIFWQPARSTTDFDGVTVRSWSNSDNSPYSVNKIDDYNIGHTSLGNHYNWTAAIASNNSSSLASSTYDNISKNPKNSICAKGWRLPIITSYVNYDVGENDLANLNYYYNGGNINSSSGLRSGPLYFGYGGAVYGTSLGSLNQEGYYWSSTVRDAGFVYSLNFYDRFVYLDFYTAVSKGYGRKGGFSVRCVAR